MNGVEIIESTTSFLKRMLILTMHSEDSSSPTSDGSYARNIQMSSKKANKSIAPIFYKTRSSDSNEGESTCLRGSLVTVTNTGYARHYLKLVLLCAFVIPTAIPYWGWNESLFNSFVICALLRYCVNLNATWLVNSAAHMWGNHPYDIHINPSENLLVTLGAVGEGFHK